jgi:hypothetical protein
MTAIAGDRSGPRARSRPRDADGGEFAAHRTQESTNVRFRHLNILAIRRRRPWRDAGRVHKSNGRLTGRPSSAIVNRVKRLHATRSSAQTTLPAARRTSHNTNVPGAMRARTTQGRAADRPYRDDGAPESSSTRIMMTRTATTSATGRASAMRRLRRRSHRAQSGNRLFCGTNGCASFLELDPDSSVATCRICGYTRRTH